MAKRKRLSPAVIHDGILPARRAGPAPIASVTGEAASAAALERLAAEMRTAREEGRIIQTLPLGAVDVDYLVRDRVQFEEGELTALMDSIRARGQQTPIEVVAVSDGRYGLISGWRRLTALKRLCDETGPDSRFATVQAVLRRPAAASDAYLSMIEENELRVGLSYYERGRIVALAVQEGVFETTSKALAGLFPTGSRAMRSKIGSFLRVYEALDDCLKHPSSIPERLGLALAKALDGQPQFADRLRTRLSQCSDPTPQTERAVLEAALREKQPGKPRQTSHGDVATGISLEVRKGRAVLSGKGVTPALLRDLQDWLRARD